MKTPLVYIVSTDDSLADSVRSLVESVGLQPVDYSSIQALMSGHDPDCRGCFVYDAETGDFVGRDKNAEISAACAIMPAILLTDRGDVGMAVHALKAGAIDIVQKPYRNQNLLDSIGRALETRPTTSR